MKTPGSGKTFRGGFGHRRSSSGGGVGVVHYEQTPGSSGGGRAAQVDPRLSPY